MGAIRPDPSAAAPFAASPATSAEGPAADWPALWAALDPAVREVLAGLVRREEAALVASFYAALLRHPEAKAFLSAQMVGERLSRSLGQWLLRLFCDPPAEGATFVAEQQRIGVVHARIGIPVHLVMQGARRLKGGIARALLRTALPREGLCQAVAHADAAIDMAIEVMSRTFVADTTQGARTEEAYRLFSLGQDVTLERETQRAALLEWSQTVLFALYGGGPDAALPAIGASDLGLWLQHKASLVFHDSPILERLHDAMRQIDAVLLPELAQARGRDPQRLAQHLEELQTRIAEVKFLLSELFQGAALLESGRDPLTRALNRRFLPAILAREVAVAARGGGVFSLLMIDVDHFKAINDRFGHPGGDAVLQAVAETVLEISRSSDFVFRYGGEEFLVMLVETDGAQALRVAERLRQRMQARGIALPDGRSAQVTVSIGVAVFQGHPDYSHLVAAADAALYRAKRLGRNRCVLAAD